MDTIHLMHEINDLKLENLQLKNQISNLELELENAVTHSHDLEQIINLKSLPF